MSDQASGRRHPAEEPDLPPEPLGPVGVSPSTVSGGTADGLPPPPPGAVPPLLTLPQPAPPADAPLPVLPGYEVLGELGRGGMGVVYQARQTGLNRLVALKMILPGARPGPDALARFHTEAEAVARLRHPNIVQIYEVGELAGLPYFSLEYVDGGTLGGRLRGGPLPARPAAELVRTLAAAVQAAHEAGVVHRDLKPGNVLMTADGTPKVADFGLAKLLGAEQGQTVSGSILGTPSYMAPEQAAGRVRDIGPATDVYALGAILYECLTGRPPFLAASAVETLLQVRAEDPVPPRRLQPQVPRDLETVVLKCLEKRPERRYASAAALADDLGRWASGQSIAARPAGAVERAWRWCRRHPAAAALASVSGLSAAVILAGGLWYHLRLTDARAAAALAQKDVESAQQLADTQEYYSRLGRVRASSADPRPGWTWAGLEEIARAARLTVPARSAAELRSAAADCLAAVDLRPQTAVANGLQANSVAFSPDGRWLAVAEQRVQGWSLGLVLLVDVTGARPARRLVYAADVRRQVQMGLPDGGRRPAFSPDGRWLVVGTRGGQLHAWDLTREAPPAVSWLAHQQEVTGLAFSPDGRALFSCSIDTTVKRWDVAGGWKQGPMAEAGQSVSGLAVSPDGALVACGLGDRVQEFEAATLAPRRVLLDQGVDQVRFHPRGAILAAGNRDRIVLIDVAGGAAVRSLQDPAGDFAHQSDLSELAFSPDGSVLVSASVPTTARRLVVDRTVKLWDVAAGRLLTAVAVPGVEHFFPAFSPDGRRLAVTADLRTLLYELAGSAELRAVAHHSRPVRAAALAPDGRALACASQSKTGNKVRAQLTVWALPDGRELPRPAVQPEVLEDGWASVAFHPSGAVVAYGSADVEVHCWDLRAGRDVGHVPPPESNSLGFSPDGHRLWAKCWSERVLSWRFPGLAQATVWDNDLARRVTGFQSVLCLAAGDRWAVGGGDDRTVRLFRTGDGQVEKVCPGPGGRVQCVALSPDESLAVAGIQDGLVRLIRVPSGEAVAELRAHQGAVMAAAFSGDGRLLATGSHDRTVRLWQRDGESVQELIALRSSVGPVAALGLSRDGGTLAVLVQNERAVRVWDLARLRARLAGLGLGW